MKRRLHKMITQRRAFKNITQSDLGALVGVSRVQICNYEVNKAIPSVAIAIKLSKILEFSLDDICVEDNGSRHVRMK